MENRQDHAHGNHGVPRMDRTPTRPWVRLECLSQNATTFKIQVQSPFLTGRLRRLREQDWIELKADPDAIYDLQDEIDLSKLEPLIAMPSNPDKCRAGA